MAWDFYVRYNQPHRNEAQVSCSASSGRQRKPSSNTNSIIRVKTLQNNLCQMRITQLNAVSQTHFTGIRKIPPMFIKLHTVSRIPMNQMKYYFPLTRINRTPFEKFIPCVGQRLTVLEINTGGSFTMEIN